MNRAYNTSKHITQKPLIPNIIEGSKYYLISQQINQFLLIYLVNSHTQPITFNLIHQKTPNHLFHLIPRISSVIRMKILLQWSKKTKGLFSLSFSPQVKSQNW